MFQRRDWVKTAVSSVAAAIFLAGCAGAASANDGVAASGNQIAPRQAMPLDVFLDAIWDPDNSIEAQTRRHTERHDRLEDLITQCMHALGFEYDRNNLPGGPGGGVQIMAVDRHPDDRDWVSQYGFGIVLQSGLMRYVWSTPNFNFSDRYGLVDGLVTDRDFEPPTHDLSDAELHAFRSALEGPPGDHGVFGLILDPEGMTPQQIAESQGCRGLAGLQMQDETPSGLLSSDEFAPLWDAVEQLNANLRQVTTPEEIDWAACMADSGFPGFERRVDPDGWGQSTNPENEIRSQRDQAINNSRWPSLATPDNTPALADLLEREIDMALADFDCRVTADWDARRAAFVYEAQTQFVNDHRVALEALRDAAEQRG